MSEPELGRRVADRRVHRHDGSATDVERELRMLRRLIETSSDLISRHTPDATFVFVSASSRSLLGYEPEEMTGRQVFEFVHVDDLPALRSWHRTVVERPRIATVTYRIRRSEGSWTWFETTGHAIRHPETDEVLEIHASSRDVSARREAAAERERLLAELAEANERLTTLANFDPLTGLANRSLLSELLPAALSRAERTGRPMAVVFLDLDGFKEVNDRLGHAVGDDVLRRFAGRLAESVRTGDTVARYGGDEFVVLAEGLSGVEEADEVAQRLIERLGEGLVADPGTERARSNGHVGVSAGVAVTHGVSTPEAVLEAADRLLYEAKDRGGGGHHVRMVA